MNSKCWASSHLAGSTLFNIRVTVDQGQRLPLPAAQYLAQLFTPASLGSVTVGLCRCKCLIASIKEQI